MASGALKPLRVDPSFIEATDALFRSAVLGVQRPGVRRCTGSKAVRRWNSTAALPPGACI